LRPGRDRGQRGQVAGAEPPVALDHHRHASGLGVVMHLVPPATTTSAESAAAATPTAASASRFGPEPQPPVVRAAVVGGHGRVPPPPGRWFLVTTAVPHLSTYTGYVPPEVGVEPAVQQWIGARGRHGHHVDDRERLVQCVCGVDQMRLELDEQREHCQR